jgi:hypothetical protein
MLRNVAVRDGPGFRTRAGNAVRQPVRVRWLIALTCAVWALVATMRCWWSWLWDRLGVASVPVDTIVWILALILTILVTPALWHRFQHIWVVVVFVVATVLIGGTAVVLSPWHDVLSRAWLRMECGPGDCTTPLPPPRTYSWRIETPK